MTMTDENACVESALEIQKLKIKLVEVGLKSFPKKMKFKPLCLIISQF